MKVITVFKTHVDIGFTDLPSKVLDSYSSNMLLRVVEICERTYHAKHPLVWTMPAFVLHYALRNCTNELKSRVERLIREDRIVWHALPFTLKTEFFSNYELSKTLFYAKDLCKTYAKPMPISAKMTDVPGHTQAIVDVLAENGIKFLHIGCNPASTTPEVPRLFFWESKKGNRILTYYDKDYGGNVIKPDEWKFPVHLCMNVSGDNVGVQSEKLISDLEETLKNQDPNAEFMVGTMDDFAIELMKCDLSDLPIIKGELGDTWIAGIGAFPDACAAIGEVRKCFEQTSKFLDEKGDTEFEALQREYLENAMLFGEHSGGVDVKKLISERRFYDKNRFLEALETEPYIYAQRGWDDETGWANRAKATALKLHKLVNEKYGFCCIDKEVKHQSNRFSLGFDGKRIIVKNKKNNKSISLDYMYEIIGKDSIDKYIDCYLTKRFDWALADFGRYKLDGSNTYPDLGDKLFVPFVKEVNGDNEYLSVVYSADKESFSVYGNAEQINIFAQNMGDRILISVDILNKQPTLYVEGGYVCFEINEKLNDVSICKSGVEINPEEDIVLGANSALFATEYVKANGFCIENIHTPLICFGEPKIYRNNICKFVMPQNGRIFFNLFNNMWATGSPQWTKGNYHFEFYIS